jgi:hypothetical protein
MVNVLNPLIRAGESTALDRNGDLGGRGQESGVESGSSAKWTKWTQWTEWTVDDLDPLSPLPVLHLSLNLESDAASAAPGWPVTDRYPSHRPKLVLAPRWRPYVVPGPEGRSLGHSVTLPER